MIIQMPLKEEGLIPSMWLASEKASNLDAKGSNEGNGGMDLSISSKLWKLITHRWATAKKEMHIWILSDTFGHRLDNCILPCMQNTLTQKAAVL